METPSPWYRIERHPVLEVPEPERVRFRFDGGELEGVRGEAVSSALFAAGVHVFGHHHADGAPQGMFCANGQCSQCTLLIDGVPRKSCIVPLSEGMDVRSVAGLPELPDVPPTPHPAPRRVETGVLVLGAGPAGMAAAGELGRAGIPTIVADDKDRPGGKLVLQTHKFFGSVEDCHAGTRGTEIASMLADELAELDSVQLWMDTIALGVWSDGCVGLRRPDGYVMVHPEWLLVTTGARESSLPFPGCTLPGVYGAGAFQTLVNRDLVRCAERVFVVGGGNVGLIAAYHAVQAGMTVVGLVEGMERCGGYKVHRDKIARLGVPVMTRRTVLAAHGDRHLEAVTTAAVDDLFRPLPGTEISWEVDTLLVAVGLTPVDEFHSKALRFGMRSLTAGDAEEIAEASAAMFTGRIRGMEIAAAMRGDGVEVPDHLAEKAEVLKSPGGRLHPYGPEELPEGVYPVLHCNQEIPCNPCMTSCPAGLISTAGHPILGVPEYSGGCTGCGICVAVCPGLAVTTVDRREDPDRPLVTIPFELGDWLLAEGAPVRLTDWQGEPLGEGKVVSWRSSPRYPRTLLLSLRVPAGVAHRVAGVRVQPAEELQPLPEPLEAPLPDEAVVCRCERVTAGRIREVLRGGVTDLNELKALTRAGFGSCGGKTCRRLLERICREEGIEGFEPMTERPLFAETGLGYFSGGEAGR